MLIAGGVVANSSQYLASTELYNPATGTFTTGPAMSTPRSNCSATLLSDGNVLLAGGYDNGVVGSADIYESATNTIVPTGTLNFARETHTATLLGNGEVLVAGGFGNFPSETGSPAELYDPTNGTFAVAASLNQSRAEPTANLLPNGMVLIAGGSGVYVLDTAELYDPVSGVFTTKSVLLNVPRAYSSETTLPDGSVLVAGGISFVSSPYSSAELYVPATGKFAYTGSLNSARYEHTATLLNNGTVLLVGGFESWDTPIGPVLGSAELFDPTTGTFSLTGSLITPRANHAATLLANGEVLITGGQGSAGDLSSAELYDPTTGTFSAAGNMTSTRYWHTSTLLNNGQVLIADGAVTQANPTMPPNFLNTAELFDPSTGTFSATGQMIFAPQNQTATLLTSGQVFIGSGNPSQLYDPGTGQFFETGNGSDTTDTRTGPSAALLPNGQVILAGGLILPMDVEPLGSDLYDPIANIIVAGDNVRVPSISATTSILLNGNVMLLGGNGFGNGIPAGTQIAEIYQSPQPGQVPSLTSVTPTTLTGFNQVVITIEGSGFLTTAVASIDAVPIATTYVSASQSTAIVPASDMTNTGNHQITVANLGGQASAPFAILIQNPIMTISPSNLTISFPSTDVGIPSGIQTATIESAGDEPLNLGPISISGTNASDFSISNSSTCPISGGTVQPGVTCTIALAFDPTASGNRSAQMAIPNNSVQPVVIMALQGNGNASPAASFSATNLIFGNQGVGSTSAPQTITLTNVGDLPLIISPIQSSGPDFPETNNCPASLAAGANCVFTITFTPIETGERFGEINIYDNSPLSNFQSITLEGMGTNVSLGAAGGGSTSSTVTSGQTATFNLQAAAVGGVNQTLSLSVNCSSVPSATCSVSPASIVLSPAAASPFSVSVVTTPYTAASVPLAVPGRHVPLIESKRILGRVVELLLAISLGTLLAVRRRDASVVRWGAVAAALALLLVLAVSGCGGGGSGSGGGGSSGGPQGTPPNTYSIVVTGSSQGTSQTLLLSLTVK